MPDLSEKQSLKLLLQKHGLQPQMKWGQNFLLDHNLLDFIVRTAEITPDDFILEIGPGTGRLTYALAQYGAEILAVEVDRGLARVTQELMADYPHFTLINTDILQNKNNIAPSVMAYLEQNLRGRKLKCISNLPYSAGTAAIANLFSDKLAWHSAVCLLQYEVAQRLQAIAGSDDYGILSVKAALASNVEILRRVPPEVFYPQPNVDSAIVQIKFLPVEQRQKIQWEKLDIVLRAIFWGRRKTISRCLRSITTTEKLTAVLDELSIKENERGENLSPPILLKLSEKI